MKKALALALAVCLALTAACSAAPTRVKNSVSPLDQTSEQREILDLLTTDKQEHYVFSYDSDAAYKEVALWVEFYEKGELLYKPGSFAMSSTDGELRSGNIAVSILHNPAYTWTLVLSDKVGHASQSITPEDWEGVPPPDLSETLGRMHGQMNSPEEISAGKEILLYQSLFSNSGVMRSYDGNPEQLKDYDYAYLVKCKFSN
ncbi:MAG: hypothetical protein LBM98_02590 [Oscillospiraceae bacterium]|jgi:hypothetical protein|nr:hypothetical protein [Oscillospiraceae bacterium]